MMVDRSQVGERAFLAFPSREERELIEPAIVAAEAALRGAGVTSIIYADPNHEQLHPQAYTQAESLAIMQEAERGLDRSDVLVALVTPTKTDGIPYEVGYARKAGLPFVAAVHEDAAADTYMHALTTDAFTWSSPEELGAKLGAVDFADLHRRRQAYLVPPTDWVGHYEMSSFNDLMDESTLREIRRAVFYQHVAVIRGVGRLSAAEHVMLAEQFGEPEHQIEGEPLHPDNEFVNVLTRSPDDRHYEYDVGDMARLAEGLRLPSSFISHHDRSFMPEMSKVTVARMEHVQGSGGETGFLDTEMALRMLPADLRYLMYRAQAVHNYGHYHAELAADSYSESQRAAALERFPAVEHDVVQTHPVTGRQMLYVNPLTVHGELMGVGDDPTLLSRVYEAMYGEDRRTTYVHKWDENDIVIWDNIGVQHYALPSRPNTELEVADGSYRTLHRVTVS